MKKIKAALVSCLSNMEFRWYYYEEDGSLWAFVNDDLRKSEHTSIEDVIKTNKCDKILHCTYEDEEDEED